MKNSSVFVLCIITALLLLTFPGSVSAEISGVNANSGMNESMALAGALPAVQPVQGSIRIRSDAPLPDPTGTPAIVPMPMGTGYNGMPMGMGWQAGYNGTIDPDLMYGGSMSGMGMCPMMSMMGGMGMMSGTGMGYGGYPGSYGYNGSYPYAASGMMGYGMPGGMMGYGGYGYNGSYPYMGGGMMGYGMPGGMMGYGGYGYNGSYPYMGGGMMGYGMPGYGYNDTADWPSRPMMGQNGFAGGNGMWGGWGGAYLPYYGILYDLLMLILILSWTIVGFMVIVYLMRKMPPRP